MEKTRSLKVMAVIMLLILLNVTGFAADNSNDKLRHGFQGPPPEAIKACEGKEVGDAVEFTDRRGDLLKATCQEVADKLVAVPKGMSPAGGPPLEAIKACEGKEVGDAVEFTDRRGDLLKATCQQVADKLVAVPKGMSPAGGPPLEAIKACEGKEVGDAVEFTDRRGDLLKATCQQVADKLVAVPKGMSPGGGPPQ